MENCKFKVLFKTNYLKMRKMKLGLAQLLIEGGEPFRNFEHSQKTPCSGRDNSFPCFSTFSTGL